VLWVDQGSPQILVVLTNWANIAFVLSSRRVYDSPSKQHY